MLLIWICFAVLTAIAAKSRGRSFLGWLFVGLITGVFGLIAVLVMARVEPDTAVVPSRYPIETKRPRGARGGPAHPKSKPPILAIRAESCGDFAVKAAGCSAYQSDLDWIAGGKTPDGVDMAIDVVLKQEPHNAYDSDAVAIWCQGRKIGYLPRRVAAQYRGAILGQGFGSVDVLASAKIVGGWYREFDLEDEEGNYGVRLDLVVPPSFKRLA